MIPPGAMGDLDTRALLALLGHHPTTFGALARHLGRPKPTVVGALYRLRAAGLVTWEPRRHGTLRPTVATT